MKNQGEGLWDAALAVNIDALKNTARPVAGSIQFLSVGIIILNGIGNTFATRKYKSIPVLTKMFT